MTPGLRITIFIAVFSSALFLMHWVVWRGWVKRPDFPRRWYRALSILIAGLGIGFSVAFWLGRGLPFSMGRWLMFPSYLWLGVVFLGFAAVLAVDLVRVTWWAFHKTKMFFTKSRPIDLPVDGERRRFLARAVAGGTALTAFSAAGFGVHRAMAADAVVTRRVEVPLARLPRELDGFRIVQLSDLHIGCLLDGAWLETIVQRVNAMGPDLVAITGDLVDGSVSDLRQEVASIGRLKAPHGVYFCTGNHEYYFGAVAWCRALTGMGIRVLRNERVQIGADSACFELAGIDDFHARGHAPGHGADLQGALADRDTEREVVLLAHQPAAIDEASQRGVGLQLSGHTHGGQLFPFQFLVKLNQPYPSGLANHHGTYIYVSEGTGFWGPPVRIGTRAEISEIILRASSAS